MPVKLNKNIAGHLMRKIQFGIIIRPRSIQKKTSRFKGKSKFSATVSKEFLNPPSDSSIFYHIHPDSIITRLLVKPKKRWHTKEFLSVSSQKPSAGDLEVAAELKKYKEFKIITSIGITSYQFHPEKINSKEEKFSRLTISKEEIYESLKHSRKYAVEKLLDRMNDHYHGVFTFSFEPF